MATKSRIYLGKEAFVLSAGGDVVRTIVAAIGEGRYGFLNGGDHTDNHWFSFGEAASAADKRIQARSAALRQNLRSLAKRRKVLESADYEEDVRRAAMKVVDLRDVELRVRTRNLMKVTIPKVLYKPGSRVFVGITPAIGPSLDVYRPCNYFVLETRVATVRVAPDGKAFYTVKSPFFVNEVFPSREEAEANLRVSHGRAIGSVIPFVSRRKELYERSMIDYIPF